VANGDRHPGNWAILERQADGLRFLAPTYDHGSALGAGLTDANRRDTSPETFARRDRANPLVTSFDLRIRSGRRAPCPVFPWVASTRASRFSRSSRSG
jgi:hypothetical protein